MLLKQASLKAAVAPRRRTVSCVCDLRKKYETVVNDRVKENVNKLLVIGSVDFKLMYEILKEVDQFHREKAKSMMKGSDDSAASTSSIDADSDSENIFLEKN
jgi:hypothetical protein